MTVGWQVNVLYSGTYLIVGQIVVEARMVVDRERLLEVFDFESHRERLVSEISQTSAKLLSDAVSVVVVGLGTIVGHDQDVRVVLLSVIVERVQEDAQTIPVVIGAKNWTFDASRCRVPDSL